MPSHPVFTPQEISLCRRAIDTYRAPGAYEPGKWIVLASICPIHSQEERFNAGSTTCLCALWKPDTPTGDASHGLSVRSRPDVSGTSDRLRGARRGHAQRPRK